VQNVERLQMRLPEIGEDLTGKVCVCSIGRPAIVVGIKEFDFGVCWIGMGLDGKGIWASSHPCIVAESALDFHNTLFDRFGGKMSFNG